MKKTTEIVHPCDVSEFTSSKLTIHKTHNIENHGNIAHKFNCCLDKFVYISDIPKHVIMHMASKHILHTYTEKIRQVVIFFSCFNLR